MKIAVLFVGALHDQGFNAIALAGAERAMDLPGGEIEIVSGIPYEAAAMTAALRSAAERSDGCVFVGGQGNRIAPEIAKAFPDCAFAVAQGEVTGANLSSYDVLQEESAFLAGVLAARMTRSGTVAHLSGHRVTPGLKGRAAFVDGVGFADPGVSVLTGFCGTQDDSAITRDWAAAMAGQGADVLFTMLNAARGGAIDACRETGMRQIGNVIDWCEVDPAVFVGSAIARIDRGIEQAICDMLAGLRPGVVAPLGLAQGDAVSLGMSRDVPGYVREQVAAIAARIAAGGLHPRTEYAGPEFSL